MTSRLILSAVLSAASIFGASARPSKDAPVPRKEVGLQLYSVRNLIGEGSANLPSLLDSLSAMGYTQVETASYGDRKFYGYAPKEFGKLCRKRGIDPISSHTTRHLTPQEIESGDFSEALAWWKDAIADHKAAGMKYIVTPWLQVGNLKELDAYCRYFDKVGEMVNAAGLKYGYHNHAHEFNKVDGEVMLDYMLANTDPSKVFYQLDVY